MGGYNRKITSYLLYFLFLITLVLIVPTSSQNSSLPYLVSGTIRENGDNYWDSNEYEFIRYIIPAGETLEIEIFTDSDAELILLYGDFRDTDDIEEALIDVIDYGDSNRILAVSITEFGYGYFSYTPTGKTDENIAIFSYNSYNPSSMSYKIYSSIESGSSGSSSTLLIFLAIAGVIAIIIILNRRKKQIVPNQPFMDHQQYQNQGGYNQQYTSYSNQPSQNQYSQQPVQTAPISNVQDVFCASCGTKNSTNSNFCNTCGEKLEKL